MSKNMKDPSTWKKTSEQFGYYKIPTKEVIGYSSIDFAMNLVFQCIALYISYFYTDIFGLEPGHVAIIFAVSRIWDAINDPMMGTICERLQPKKANIGYISAGEQFLLGLQRYLHIQHPALAMR